MTDSHHHKSRRDSTVTRFLKFPEQPAQAKMLMDQDRETISKLIEEISKLEGEVPQNTDWEEKMSALKGCVETRERYIKVYEEVLQGPTKSKFY